MKPSVQARATGLDEGQLQLPDFQRSYVWGDDDVVSLIASIAKGFPVGALLTLETSPAEAAKRACRKAFIWP